MKVLGMIKTIKVKLNVDMLQYKKGSILTLTNQKHSGEGVFLCPYFKRRIEDSKIDNCLEIINNIDDDENYITVNRAEKSSLDGIKTTIAKPKKRGRPKDKKAKKD